MSKKILIINGPNLNTLGTRQTEIYGKQTLGDIEKLCKEEASSHKLEVDFRQSNDEGEIVSWIQKAAGEFDGIIINAAAYTHTSAAIMDALLSVDIPIVEVHLSNIFQREEFRHHSFVSNAATGMICGFGATGYVLAIRAISELV